MENTIKRLWDDLSLSEKADVMEAAVRNGITTLPEIKEKWNEFAEGGPLDSVGNYADAVYQDASEQPYGDPTPHYYNVDEDAIAWLLPDKRGHYDDSVKLPNHPSSPIRGTFNGQYFDLTDTGMDNPNYSLFGLLDNGDGDVTMRYNGATVIPELTVTPQGNYYDNTYDNIRITKHADGGNLFKEGGYTNENVSNEQILGEDSQKTHEFSWDKPLTYKGQEYPTTQMVVDNVKTPVFVDKDSSLYALDAEGKPYNVMLEHDMPGITVSLNRDTGKQNVEMDKPPVQDESIDSDNELIYPQELKNEDFAVQEKKYEVKKGDTLWGIARKNHISVDKLKELNPNIKGGMMHIGDQIVTGRTEPRQIYDLREDWANEDEWNKSNVSAIMNAPHKGNYVLVDKDKHLLQIFDKDNNLLYSTYNIATGESGNDYNTITKADLSEKQNMSTPAGISWITSTGKYHGAPSFQRNRNYSEAPEDAIASSIHIGNTKNSKSSNGCIRVGSASVLNQMSKFIGSGTPVYTLPSKGGSRFTLSDGNLNFTADNPYGNDDKNNPRRFWDDYNVVTDKSYHALMIKANGSLPKYETYNANQFARGLVNSKKTLQKDLGMSSGLYNRLASIALGIAQQESEFGESSRYKIKQKTPDIVLNTLRGDSNRSRGLTQIKIAGDNQELQKLYKKYNITEDTILDPEVSARATMIRLWYMYTHEGSSFTGEGGKKVQRMDALLYKWMGKNDELKNKTATPEKNKYIKHVKKYSNMFNLYSVR